MVTDVEVRNERKQTKSSIIFQLKHFKCFIENDNIICVTITGPQTIYKFCLSNLSTYFKKIAAFASLSVPFRGEWMHV